jgi:hypothetical protein
MKKIVLLLIPLALIGCATAPDKISPTYVSPSKYNDFTCNDLKHESREVEQRVNALHHKLQKERNQDNTAMTIGMVLFWPALFFIDGDGPDAQTYAKLKGEAVALDQASRDKKCHF